MEEQLRKLIKEFDIRETGNKFLDEQYKETILDVLVEFVGQEIEKAREEGSKHMQGWECPKCGSVYSPLTFECSSCKNSGIRVVTSDKTSGYDNTSYLN